VMAHVGQPPLVLKSLRGLLAVDRRHRMDREANIGECLGEMSTSQAAVDEELRRPGRLRRVL
jgi:hypothetical protein